MATVIDLSALGTGGFVIEGAADTDQAGYSVSSAGDVNGDGYDDFAVGAIFGDDESSAAGVGTTYVIFGKGSGFATIDLASLSLAEGFIIYGDALNDRASASIASAGDVNADGFDDIIV